MWSLIPHPRSFVREIEPAGPRGADWTGFIFAGTFERLGASNLSLLPASTQTALVRVSEVIDQPEVFGRIRGSLVTVMLADTAGAAEGGQAIFFTNGLLYGEHLAVREVARNPGRPGVSEEIDVEQMRKDVALVRRMEADEALSTRLASAAAVVSGRVGDVRPLRRGEEMGEHSASWVLATLEIDATLKGHPATAV